VGAEDFLDRLLGKWEGKMGEHRGGQERSETEIEKARRLIEASWRAPDGASNIWQGNEKALR